MGSVELKNIRKSFGNVEVLHGINVKIDDGEFVVLVGPSGCGKSTLLRSLAGLETISGGDIMIDDRSIVDLPPKSRDIAMVFQNYALYPHMTVEQNMGFSLRLAGADAETKKQKVWDAAIVLGLEDLLARYPRQLSGGQRQRVAMGRAIVRDPAVFLFDEPLSNLDAKLRVQMRTEIKALHQRLGTTIVYVTHDQIEAMTMADKIVVLRDGIVEQVGGPLTLYDHPANTFVAGFIGSPAMNLIPGTIDEKGKVSVSETVGINTTIQGHDGDVVVGIRPEDIAIAGKGLPTEVLVVEPTGAETQIFLQLGGHSLVANLRERVNPVSGQTVKIALDSNKIHVFESHSGRSLNQH